MTGPKGLKGQDDESVRDGPWGAGKQFECLYGRFVGDYGGNFSLVAGSGFPNCQTTVRTKTRKLPPGNVVC